VLTILYQNGLGKVTPAFLCKPPPYWKGKNNPCHKSHHDSTHVIARHEVPTQSWIFSAVAGIIERR